MQPEIIKDKSTYKKALAEIDKLIEIDPSPNTEDGKRLELLAHLAKLYEQHNFSAPKTNPIDAILFRMEQDNLKQIDLVPYIGSRSKVSEVLSGKRPLTLSMIQALHSGLGIPAGILLQTPAPIDFDVKEIDWKRFPVKEMLARGWIQGSIDQIKDRLEYIFEQYFEPVGGLSRISALYKTSPVFVRAGREMNRYALVAWTARVMSLALNDPPEKPWEPNYLTLNTMREIAQLSRFPEGPLDAKRILRDYGISLIIEPALPQTYLDGAAIMIIETHPIIGLSLRYDRIDNFWFTLMHELSHILLHFGKGVNQFFDDLDLKKADDPREIEADECASDALIPKKKWLASPARVAPTKNAILQFARQIDVHPAIVAGRVRRERSSYHLFNDIVGHGRIRYLFGLAPGEE